MILLVDILLFSEKNSANEHTEFLHQMCLISFDSEMTLAGKTPPEGTANLTCNCFLEEISLGYSVESAKKKCKEYASKNFNL